ncbi:hypothetical protein [Xanthobacter flavus]|uniref:hypothetical protein n=1 Tax=Xanthobacter flavus TaxID=281 RepID=UPI00372879F6
MAGEFVFDGNELDLLGRLAQKAWFHGHTMVSREELAREGEILRLPPTDEADIAGLIRKGLIEEPIVGQLTVTVAG